MAAIAAAFVPAGTVAKGPVAGFGWAPLAPAAGQAVVLTATPAPDIAAAVWDFDGDNVFDALGMSVTTTFAVPGPHVVGLVVFDTGGGSASVTLTVPVGPPAPPPPPPPPAIAPPPPPPALMTPFPVVRLQGRLVRGGILITRLTVHAPAGATVHVTCLPRGRGCPSKPSDGISRAAAQAVRVPNFERRLRAGAIVQVYVGNRVSIGKYTSFRVRRRGAPLRRDLCLTPGIALPARCPGG